MRITTNDLEFKYKQIYQELEENGGDLTPELEEALAINEDDFEERVDNYFGIITQNNGDIDKLKSIKATIDAKIKAKTNVNAYIEEVLKKALMTTTPATLTKAGRKTYSREFSNLQITLNASPSVAVDVTDMQKVADAMLGNYSIEIKSNDKKTVEEIKKILPNIEIESTFAPDKKAIGDKLKAGETVEGAELITNYNFKFK